MNEVTWTTGAGYFVFEKQDGWLYEFARNANTTATDEARLRLTADHVGPSPIRGTPPEVSG